MCFQSVTDFLFLENSQVLSGKEPSLRSYYVTLPIPQAYNLLLVVLKSLSILAGYTISALTKEERTCRSSAHHFCIETIEASLTLYSLYSIGEKFMTTSSYLSNHSRQDIEHFTFAERVQLGAENAVRCMGVTASDRVFIITDYERESIARHVATAVLDWHADVAVR